MEREELIKEIVDAVCSELGKTKCVDGGICILCGECIQKNPAGTEAILNAGATRIASSPGSVPSNKEIAKFIDHTLLKPDATEDDIRKLCAEAIQYGFASVCVNPYWVALCAELLKDSSTKVCTVIGFPLGTTTTETKVFEAKQAKKDGAEEFDMVINIGALKSGDYRAVYDDIKSVVESVSPNIVKVIIETALLTDEEKVEACAISREAGANFVKTSTGFSGGGATVADVQLMKSVVGSELEVKASGGVRDYETAMEMIKAGASRIGASAGIAIITGEQETIRDY
ncbi:deoxyribose-phosphate aldolase [bacterium]|nr:MAG: deoxyribose-phosphate aldolase [bacterium]